MGEEPRKKALTGLSIVDIGTQDPLPWNDPTFSQNYNKTLQLTPAVIAAIFPECFSILNSSLLFLSAPLPLLFLSLFFLFL